MGQSYGAHDEWLPGAALRWALSRAQAQELDQDVADELRYRAPAVRHGIITIDFWDLECLFYQVGPYAIGRIRPVKRPVTFDLLSPALVERLRAAQDVSFLRKVPYSVYNENLLIANLQLFSP